MTEQHIDTPPGNVLSEKECGDILVRAARLANGGGQLDLHLEHTWKGVLRFARNRLTSTGDTNDNVGNVIRNIHGATWASHINSFDDVPLEATIRRAERMLRFLPEYEELDTYGQEHSLPFPTPPAPTSGFIMDSAARAAAMQALISPPRPYPRPKIFFSDTASMTAEQRADAVAPLFAPVKAAGFYVSGYAQVEARTRALMSTLGQFMYQPFTTAQLSVTVRSPDGTGSGWAGIDWSDWRRVDGAKLIAIAIDKCARSMHPVVVEPGRYTAVLEPQAVCDITISLMQYLGVPSAFVNPATRKSRIGERMLDNRITISVDPSDPDCSFPSFDIMGVVFDPIVWFEHGVLKRLPYQPGPTGEPSTGNSAAMRMSGGPTTIEEMIATTKRGIYVTRFSNIAVRYDEPTFMTTGYTRDGTWLIENGKISKAIKNFRITESPFFVLNNVEQLGVPQRVFHPLSPAMVHHDFPRMGPVVCPPLKVHDFNFTSLSEAV